MKSNCSMAAQVLLDPRSTLERYVRALQFSGA
jgi:hypothetical protein